jgi:LacI family transcriptional regulator
LTSTPDILYIEPLTLPLGVVGRPDISTIKEIASRANVSIGTVDRVLHGRGRVSAETEDRVRRIIAETDYRPNIFAKHLRLGRTFAFGVVMPKSSQDSSYWTLPAAGVARAQRELAGQRVATRFFFFDKYAPASVQRVLRDVLRTPLDGLLVAPVVAKAFEEFLAGIPPTLPYVLFDSFLPKNGQVSYIGQDAFQSGVLSARLMRLVMGGAGSVAVLRALPEDYHIDDRARGFASCFHNAGEPEVEVFEIETNRGAEARGRVFARVLEPPGRRGVFVTNASTHQVAAFIRDRGLAGRVHVIGYDLVEENVRLLREGVIDVLLSQRPERQGYIGIQTLFRHVVLKEPVERTIMMPLDIVVRENVDHYH